MSRIFMLRKKRQNAVLVRFLALQAVNLRVIKATKACINGSEPKNTYVGSVLGSPS